MSIIEKAMEKARIKSAEQPPAAPVLEGKPEVPEPLVEKSVHPSKIRTLNPKSEIIMAYAESSSQGEEYRLLKEHILSLRKQKPDMSLFMVSSPMRNEGKTVVSCNLAAAMAREFDHTVLLVDADLRAPKCHLAMGLEGRPKGLADCLMYGDSFADHVIHTDIGRLSILCAGSPVEGTSELFTSNRMRDFLREIKHRYPDRIIILDTLPLVPFAESRALGRMVDGILLVVRENMTVKAHLDNALRSLEGCPVLGVVYNGASSYGLDKEVFELVYGY